MSSFSQPRILHWWPIIFPVDPRDFAAQAIPDSVEACSPNIAATDAPFAGGYQFSWSLGIPFLKRLSFLGFFCFLFELDAFFSPVH